MDNVIAFTPRQRPPEPEAPAPLAGLALRAHLEDAAQVALDAADRIIAALDRIEDGEGANTALAPHVVHLREPAAPIIAPPEPTPEIPPETLQAEPESVVAPEIRAVFPPLPWGGAGNVVAATGCAHRALVAGAR